MSQTHEERLVRAAQSGDQRAQDELVSAYLPLVYNIVGRALSGHADVDDVVQETMIRALGGLGSLRDPKRFRSWLVAITMNRIRDHRFTPAVAGGPYEGDDLADPGADFVDLTILRLGLSGQRREAAEATRWLDDGDRELLSLWWLEAAGELSRAEVVDALELTPQHTAVRVQRMKAQLETARIVVRALAADPRCVLLDDVLAGWDGVPSALWRKRIARHARDCTVCAGHAAGLVPAEGLLVGLGLVPVGAALAGACAGADAGEAFVLAGAGSPDLATAGPVGSGTHGATGRAAGGRGGGAAGGRRLEREARRRRRRRGAAAGVAALLVAGGGVAGLRFLGPEEGAREVRTQTATPPSGSPLAPSATPARPSTGASASPSPSVSASPSASATATKKAKPTPAPTRTAPKPPPEPSPSRTRSAPRSEPAEQPSGSFAEQVTRLVNSERAKNGCGPVSQNGLLDTAARRHSDDMAARDYFDHTSPDGKGPGDRITEAGYAWSTYGENIARGQQTPASVMDSWMNSPGHRANILNCSFKEIGIGIHEGSGGPWWTQVFGARS
ncbi:sigma-70 family RNA polymerase sigma factor [Streptomyces sp. NPDC049837]|uniref:sigma-70 family RNA polymerase sigma factor n=1 Tax=Streptomyces sp. NPDC049837 TaxID=3155277 RepID=UPI00341B98B5